MESNLLTVKEVAAQLRISLSEAYSLCNKGVIPALRIGKRTIRVQKEALDEYLAGCQIQQPARIASPPARRKPPRDLHFRHLTGDAIPRGMRPRD